ncbi:hypothetical protein AKJ16_DCAP27090 [Drosera capensis]
MSGTNPIPKGDALLILVFMGFSKTIFSARDLAPLLLFSVTVCCSTLVLAKGRVKIWSRRSRSHTTTIIKSCPSRHLSSFKPCLNTVSELLSPRSLKTSPNRSVSSFKPCLNAASELPSQRSLKTRPSRPLSSQVMPKRGL